MPRIFRSQPRRSGQRVVRTGNDGYTSKWMRFSQRYRRHHPFCALCEEKGLLVYADLVDHKYPVADGGPMYPEPGGLMGLCSSHHGLKARWEDLARRTGQMDRIVEWCDNPQLRPRIRGEIL